jgi:peptide/nickel transport system ATP-binding protein
MNLLEIKKLTINYETDEGVVHAVNKTNLSLNVGETLGLVGETGAGKTTTALGIMGLIPKPPGKVVEGEIYYKNDNLLKKSEREMRKIRGKEIAMIFQDPMTALNPVIPTGKQVAEVIRLHLKCSQAEAKDRALSMLELVGIPKDRYDEYPHQFSGGMKQRIVIAIAIACNPKLLIADEPTTALDVTIQAQVLSLINELREKLETSMILITHDFGIVAETCDKVAVMYAGEIIEYGAIKNIFTDMKHPYTKGLFESIPQMDSQSNRLDYIKGLMPDPMALPNGCKFHPRCPYTMPVCSEREPDDYILNDKHLVKCFLCEKSK